MNTHSHRRVGNGFALAVLISGTVAAAVPSTAPAQAGSGCDARFSGGAGSNLIFGNDNANTMCGRAGDDRLFGDGGRDTLYGDGGAEQLFGGYGGDRIDGGRDSDYLYGQGGDDTLLGRHGRDRLFDDNDRDRGKDLLIPGAGRDHVTTEGGVNSVRAVDGQYDTIVCALDATDTVHADGPPNRDFVSRNCENVIRH